MPRYANRRGKSRHFGQNLIVLAGENSYPVLDISSAGLSFRGEPFATGDVVTLSIASETDMAQKVEANCLVVAIRLDVTHISFTRVTMTLLTFVIDHMGSVLGVQPYYFGAKPDG